MRSPDGNSPSSSRSPELAALRASQRAKAQHSFDLYTPNAREGRGGVNLSQRPLPSLTEFRRRTLLKDAAQIDLDPLDRLPLALMYRHRPREDERDLHAPRKQLALVVLHPELFPPEQHILRRPMRAPELHQRKQLFFLPRANALTLSILALERILLAVIVVCDEVLLPGRAERNGRAPVRAYLHVSHRHVTVLPSARARVLRRRRLRLRARARALAAFQQRANRRCARPDAKEPQHPAYTSINQALIDVLDEHDLRVLLQDEPRGRDHLLENARVAPRVARGVLAHGPRKAREAPVVGGLDLRA